MLAFIRAELARTAYVDGRFWEILAPRRLMLGLPLILEQTLILSRFSRDTYAGKSVLGHIFAARLARMLLASVREKGRAVIGSILAFNALLALKADPAFRLLIAPRRLPPFFLVRFLAFAILTFKEAVSYILNIHLKRELYLYRTRSFILGFGLPSNFKWLLAQKLRKISLPNWH